MRYEEMVRTAWRMAWQHRYLWLFGVFSGGATSLGVSGAPSSSSGDWSELQRDLQIPAQEIEQGLADAMQWVNANLGVLIVVATVGFLAIAVVVLIFGCIASGCGAALTGSTLRLARGEPDSFHRAWESGARNWGRYFRLWLLLGLLALIIGLIIAAIIGGAIANALTSGINALGIVVGLVLSAPLLLLAFVGSLVLSVLVPLAQRAMVDRDLGAIAGLRVGWSLLRRRLGRSFMHWLVAVIMGIIAAIIAAIALVCVAIAAAIVLVPVWMMAGATAPLWIAISLVALLLVLAGLAFGGLCNTVFWGYWTLAYLDLSETPLAASPTTPAPPPAAEGA